jgi:hypothetical protein
MQVVPALKSSNLKKDLNKTPIVKKKLKSTHGLSFKEITPPRMVCHASAT